MIDARRQLERAVGALRKMIILVLRLLLLALFAFEDEHVAGHRHVNVLGVNTRQLGRDFVRLLVLAHVDRRRGKAERTAPLPVRYRTSGAATGNRTRRRTDRTAGPFRCGTLAIRRGQYSAPAALSSLQPVPLPFLSPSVSRKETCLSWARESGGALIQRNSPHARVPIAAS